MLEKLLWKEALKATIWIRHLMFQLPHYHGEESFYYRDMALLFQSNKSDDRAIAHRDVRPKATQTIYFRYNFRYKTRWTMRYQRTRSRNHFINPQKAQPAVPPTYHGHSQWGLEGCRRVKRNRGTLLPKKEKGWWYGLFWRMHDFTCSWG